jgi:oxygen-independent coproporphyrinogen III oxidase
VSAIGRIGPTYHQNAKTLPEYYEALRAGRLPVVRGIALTDDDLLRRDVIMDIMCRGRLDFGAIARKHSVVRAIAMVFDRYLQSDKTRERFSRIL